MAYDLSQNFSTNNLTQVLARKIIVPIAVVLCVITFIGATYANLINNTNHLSDMIQMYFIAVVVTIVGIIASFFSIQNILSSIYVLNVHNKELKGKLAQAYNQLIDLKMALDNTSNTVIITSFDGKIEYINDAFVKNTGYSKSEALGQNSTKLQAYNPKDKVYKTITNTIHSGKTWKGNIRNKKKNGKLIWMRVSISPVYNDKNEIYKFVTIKEDITKEKLVHENLKQSYKKLKDVDVKKNDFISIASHELRTPMTVIKGYSSLLIQGTLGDINDAQKGFLDKIFKNTNQLIDLVNDMLDLSKLESGSMPINMKSIDLLSFTEDCIEEFAVAYKEKNVELNVSAIKLKKVKVKADTDNLLRVMRNLLSNALKFTPSKGKVEVIIEKATTTKFLQVSVKDSGIGIPEDKISELFEKFSQVEHPEQRPEEGTGLGLAIVKDIVEKFEGKIWVKSKINKGTSFIFTLLKA